MESHIDILSFDFSKLTSYSTLLFILAVIILIGFFLQKRVRSYLTNRNKLKTMAKSYNRKRKSRNELKVSLNNLINA